MFQKNLSKENELRKQKNGLKIISKLNEELSELKQKIYLLECEK